MKNIAWSVCVTVALMVLCGGCAKFKGSASKDSAENKLAEEQIAILNNMIAEYEKVTDATSMSRIQPTIKALWDRFAEISQEFQALPTEKKESAMNIHALQIEQALARMRAAKENAAKVASS